MLKRVLRNMLIITLISSLCIFSMPVVANATETDGQYNADVDEKNKDDDGNNIDENQGSGDNQGNENTEDKNQNPGDQSTDDNNQTGDNTQNSGNTGDTGDTGSENNSGVENNNTGNGSNSQDESNSETENNNPSSSGNAQNGNNGSSTQNKPTQSVPTSATVKSSDANLRNLKVDVEGMTPEFNRNITEYYLIVDLSVENVNVSATTADTNANVEITGNENLQEGDNTITITVTAENGDKKEYIIHVTKTKDKEKANANLKSLIIDGYNVSPSFKSNIYNYTLSVNEAIKNLNIIAEPESEKAKVEIIGNTDLKEGENLIEISITAEDEITVVKYKIKVFIDTNIVKVKEEGKLPGIILLVILGTCVVAIITSIIIKKRK